MIRALISALLLICPLSAFAGQLSGPPIAELRPALRPGFIGVRNGPLLPEMVSIFNANFDRETSGLEARGAEQRPFCAEGADASDPLTSSVMLLALYRDGQFRQGSGTVIRGSGVGGQPDRVLTASHVLPPHAIDAEGRRSPLTRILAFGSDGRELAELGPVLAGDIHALDRVNDADMIFDDVAVLEPVSFTDPAARQSWSLMGAGLAPAQPERLMALFQPPGSVALNPGMSGAGVFDESGALIGVLSYTLYLSGDPFLDRPDTGYEARVFTPNQGAGAPAWASDLRALTATQGRRLRRDNVGYAAPIRHAEVRAALNASGPAAAAAPDGYALIAGYPRLSCLSVGLRRLGTGLPLASSHMRALANFETRPPVAQTDAGPETIEVTHE